MRFFVFPLHICSNSKLLYNAYWACNSSDLKCKLTKFHLRWNKQIQYAHLHTHLKVGHCNKNSFYRLLHKQVSNCLLLPKVAAFKLMSVQLPLPVMQSCSFRYHQPPSHNNSNHKSILLL